MGHQSFFGQKGKRPAASNNMKTVISGESLPQKGHAKKNWGSGWTQILDSQNMS